MKISVICAILLISTKNYAGPFKFLKDINISTGTMIGDYPIGGLSGCTYDEMNDRLWAVSDDRSERGPARLYQFELNFKDGYQIKPKGHLLLLDSNGKYFLKDKVDFEAITILDDGSFIVVSEGNGYVKPRIPPAIMHFDFRGRRLKDLPLPQIVIPEATKTQTKGVRNNLAFESLTQIPGTQKLAIISEQALIQDGPETSNSENSPSRLFISQNEKVISSYVYLTDSFHQILGENILNGDSGVAEALALSEREFLVLERSFFPTLLKVRIRLFKATIQKDSTDVLAWNSLRDKKFVPIKKELLVDFNDFLSQLDPAYGSLDNIESMCWGPKLKNGKRSLILISDNNFKIFQRTQFIILEASSDL